MRWLWERCRQNVRSMYSNTIESESEENAAMTQRTLIEINHDFTGEIDGEDTQFVIDLVSYLRAGGERSKQNLERYGIRG